MEGFKRYRRGMPTKTPPPAWAVEAVQPIAQDLVRRALSGLTHAEASQVSPEEFAARPGRLQPALMLALLDELNEQLNAAGRELVQAYCDRRKEDEGLSARKVMEQELSPSMGMARASIATAFGYQHKRGARPKPDASDDGAES